MMKKIMKLSRRTRPRPIRREPFQVKKGEAMEEHKDKEPYCSNWQRVSYYVE